MGIRGLRKAGGKNETPAPSPGNFLPAAAPAAAASPPGEAAAAAP